MIKVKSIWKYIKVGDTVRYLGDLIEVKRKATIDKIYFLKDIDQLYKDGKLFAEKVDSNWQLI